MARHELDCKGLRCPQPILTIITYMPSTQPGDILEVTADCETFEEDVRKWCERMGKTLLAVTHDGPDTTTQIQI